MRFKFFIILSLLASFSFGQESNKSQVFQTYKENKVMGLEKGLTSLESFLDKYSKQLGLGSADNLEIKKAVTLRDGRQIIRLGHSHDGLEVVGSELVIHIVNGEYVKAAANIFPKINVELRSKVKLDDLKDQMLYDLERSMKDFSYPPFDLEQMPITNDGLCIIDKQFPNFSGNYMLAYKLSIAGISDSGEVLDEVVFANAVNGKLITHYSNVHFERVKGIVNTKYYGEKEVYMDSLSGGTYLLSDKLKEVHTLDGSRDTFVNHDKYWNQYNEFQNEVAGDVHYGASALYDLMYEMFAWEGLDGNGRELTSVVHARGKFYVNAFWDGNRANFGNGDCDRYGPLTTLDIVGHEFAHGLTDHTSDLVYRDESGALNESISDIFGKALEYYYDRNHFNWLLGDKIRLDPSVNYFRSMEDPNLRNHPKYYNGLHWRTGTSDNGGVHSNSGVFNYWFYLLVEGGANVNERGVFYDVSPIGMDKALQIVFLMQTAYLTSGSNYFDAFTYSLEACKDLFGSGSQEEVSLTEAWKAVGLFEGFNDLDLSIVASMNSVSLCPSSEIQLEYWIHNVGSKAIDAGTSYMIECRKGGAVFVSITGEFENTLLPLDSMQILIPEIFTSSDFATGQINCELVVDGEYNTLNNNASTQVYVSAREGLDVVLESVDFITENECGVSDINRFRYRVRNVGCVSIPEGETFQFDVMTDKGNFELSRNVFFDFDPGDIFGSTSSIFFEPIPLDFTEYSVNLIYEDESNTMDNTATGEVVHKEFMNSEFLIDFEDGDEKYLELNMNEDFIVDTLVTIRNNKMLGLLANSSFGIYRNCEDDIDFFDQFVFKASMDLCVDTREMQHPRFSFDMMEFKNKNVFELLDNEDYSTMVKVSLDDSSFDDLLFYGQSEGKLIHREFDLPTEYVGQVNFQVLVYSSNPNADYEDIFGNRDIILFDDLRLFDQGNAFTDYRDLADYIVYPNPAKDLVKVINKNIDAEFDIEIYNTIGQFVYHESGIVNQSWVDLTNLNNGIYHLVIFEGGEKVGVKKFVKM